MTMLRKISAVVLFVLCAVLCAMGIGARAVTAEGTCGDNLTWVLYDDGELVIDGTGAMTNWSSSSYVPWYSYRRSTIKTVSITDSVTSIGSYAFYNCYSLTSVTIPDSVTTIGDYAFNFCDRLTSVTIPDSVTSIGSYAFSYCGSLTSVTIPDSVTSFGSYAFFWCDSLTSVTIGNSVTTIGDCAFNSCESLTSVTIGSSVTTIGMAAFLRCSYLTSVTIPDSVTTIGDYAFENCRGLTSVTIGNSVTSIGERAFTYCESLTSVTIPYSVTIIGEEAFTYCDSLTEIHVDENNASYSSDEYGVLYSKNKIILICYPSGNTRTRFVIPDSVTAIGNYAFFHCTGLTSVTIPDSVTAIGNYAFCNCTLTSVTIPDSVTTIGDYAFQYCDSLTEIHVDENNVSYSSDEYGVLYNKNKIILICYPNGNTRTRFVIPDSVTSIGEGAFSYCTGLTSVTIPYSVTSIGEGAFSSCTGLTSVTIPYSVTSIGDGAFTLCDSLTSVTIGDSVTLIGNGAFSFCRNLKSVTIFSIDVTFGTDVFYGCSYDCTLYGYAGYNTETYAENNGHLFVPLKLTPDIITSIADKLTIDSFSIKIVNIMNGIPVSGAVVSFGGEQKFTDSEGKVRFSKPASASAELTITALDYTVFSLSDYSVYRVLSFDVIELAPVGVTGIIPKTCNGESISTSYAQINNKADLYAEIDIGGVSHSEIESFELRQNGAILAKSSTGKFKLHNSVFKEGVPIIAYIQTTDGKSVKKELNINVVSFSFYPTVFPFGAETIKIPEDVVVLGGLELKFANKDETKEVSAEITNSEIKVGYQQEVKGKDLSALNKGLRKWMKTQNRKTPSSEITFDIAGFVVIEMGNQGVKDTYGEIHFILEYSNGFSKTFQVIYAPVTVEVEFTIGGELIIKTFGFDFEKSVIIFPELEGAAKLGIGGKGGVGWTGISLGAYVDLEGKFEFDILPNFEANSLTAKGVVGGYADAWLFKAKLPIFSGELVIYDKDRNRSVTTYSLQAFADAIYDESNYYLDPREYLPTRTDWSTTADGILQSSTYDNIAPQIVTMGDTTLMLFIDDNGGDDSYNYQQLSYSILTPDGWSTPAPVDTNSRNDAEFDLTTDGENIWVIYTEANRAITEADEMTDYAGLLDVTAARFDPASGTFTDHAVLTSNAVMERLPAITVVNGIPTAVWVENADNNLFGMGENNTVYTSTYENGAWTTPAALYDAPAVAELDAGILDGALAIALVCDSDSDFTTTGDSVMTVLCGGRDSAYIGGEYSGVHFDGNTLYWRDGDGLYSTASFDGEETLLTEALTADSAADFDVVTADGVKHIFYREYNTEGEHGGSDIYVIKETENGWTLPVRLTETEGYIDSYDAIAMDGNIHVVYRRTDVTFTEDDMTAVSALHAETIAPAVALTVSDITFDHEELFDDKTVTLTVSVTNNGIESANGFRAAVDGTYVDYTDTVEAGETVEIDITAALPPYGEPDLTVTVTDEIGMTTAETVTVGYADFTVSLEPKTIGGVPYINASVSNVGNGIGEGVLNIRRDDEEGEIIYTEEIYLAPGEQKNILSEVLDDTLTQVYMEFIPAEEDYFDGDNRTSCAIMRPTGEGLDVRLVGDMNNDDAVDIDDAMLLFRNSMLPEVYPTDYTENTDFNGDGDVDIRDAQRLFQYSMLPDVYPIG